jgi:hypothetical protein
MSDDDDDVKGKGRDKAKGGKPKIARAGSAIANLGQDTVEDGVSTLFDVGSRLIAAIKGVRYNLKPRGYCWFHHRVWAFKYSHASSYRFVELTNRRMKKSYLSSRKSKPLPKP